MKKIRFGILLVILFLGILMKAFDVQGTWIVQCLTDTDPNTVYVFAGGKPDVATLNVLRQLKADVAYRVFFTYGENLQQVKARWSGYQHFIQACHESGIKVGAIISAAILEPENFNTTFVQNVATRDANGTIILLYQENVGNYYHHGCLNNEMWRAHLVEIAKFAVDLGIDIIEFDEATSHWWWPGECYCDKCIMQFRDYLKEKYSTEELLDRFNITNVDIFNYRDYLATFNLTTLDEWTRLWSHPLGHEYYIFELTSLTKHFDELAFTVKSYARNQNKKIMVCANQFELKNIDVPLTKSVDFMSIGTSLKVWARILEGNVVERFGPPHYVAAPFILLGRALNNSKHSVMFIDTDYIGVTEKMVKVLIADALAFGGFYNLPYYSGTVGSHAGLGPINGFKDYALFMDVYHNLFHNFTSLSRVGLLFPYETILWSPPPSYAPWVYGACQVLVDSHIPYDIIFVGDGNVVPNSLQLIDLKKYDVLFLPHINFISNATVELLKQFLTDGGKLVMTGYNAIWDEMGFEHPHRLDDIISHENVSYIPQLDWATYWDYIETKNENTRKAVAHCINNFTFPTLETNASSKVGINVAFHPEDKRLLVHFVNYDYHNENDSIIEIEYIHVKLKKPESFDASTAESVWLSPDFGLEQKPLQYSILGDYIEFTLPKLQTYSIAVIGTPLPTYTLTITATAGGTTNPSPETYTCTTGSSVQVMAIPSSGYVFDHWELNGSNVGSANPYTVIMDNNYNLKAFFILTPPPLTVSISPTSASILAGQSVTFTSTASGGTPPYNYQWYMNDNPVSGATSPTWTFTPTASGIFYVYLKVTDSKGNSAQSDAARITVSTVPVGGYSIPINIKTRIKPTIPCIALIAALTIAFMAIKQKTRNKQ